MPRARLPYAERMRRHRAAFLLALDLGITPREAEAELDRREALERHKATTARLTARKAALAGHPAHPAPSAADDPERPPPWWNRD